MTGRAHLFGGTLIGASYTLITDYTVGIPFAVGSMIGSLFPDIDSWNTKASNMAPLLSFVVRLFARHRGIVHTPLFLLILCFIIYPITTMLHFPEHFLFGFICGFLCHLIQDTMTRRGIKWLYPISDKVYRILYLKSGKGLFLGFIETTLTLLVVGIILFPIVCFYYLT